MWFNVAGKARVLDPSPREGVREPLEKLQPMEAVFDNEYVRRIHGPNVKEARTKMDKAQMLMEDIRNFQNRTGVARTVMIWCGSTEVFHRAAEVHETLKDFEAGLANNDHEIAPSQIHAAARLKSGIPSPNGGPS